MTKRRLHFFPTTNGLLKEAVRGGAALLLGLALTVISPPPVSGSGGLAILGQRSQQEEQGVATFWQRASATSQTERGASGLDQHGRASTARNAPRGKLPAAVTLPRPWVGSSAFRNVPSCL